MNVRTSPSTPPPPVSASSATPATATPRFDRKFIEDNKLLDRYLEHKLPVKGARELENWCRDNPEFLNELKLAERTHASLKLLEASGSPPDLGETQPPWWKTLYFLIGLGLVTFICLVAFWALFGKYVFLRGQLEDVRSQLQVGSLVPPTAQRSLRVFPDRAPGIDRSRISVSRATPLLLNLQIDMSYSRLTQFRLTLDKKDQGRALVLEEMAKDSNGDLKLAFNTSGLTAGIYNIRVEGLPFRGSPIAEGWLVLDVH
jgi:hypothetical protein